jgi:mannose-6-phosphate isomerase class I
LATFSIQLHPNKTYAHALHVVSALQILWINNSKNKKLL